MTDDPFASGKRAAARRAVDAHVRSGMVLGVGSGSTIVFAVERLGELRRADPAFRVTCVPTSYQSRGLVIEHGLELSDLDRHPELDVCIDGADECDASLACIKGGGGAQTQEKIVAAAAKLFVVIADDRKRQTVLGTEWKKGVPVEVVPMGVVPAMRRMEKLGGKPVLRMAKAKAGPCVTDNGNLLVDVDFGQIRDPGALNLQLSLIPGVVETGLFVDMAAIAYFGKSDGSVVVVERPEAAAHAAKIAKSGV